MIARADIAARPEAGLSRSKQLLGDAVRRDRGTTAERILERLFTLAFSNLVYAQIWEDPVIDMEALSIQPDSHMVVIASGGCNVMSYLAAAPARITAVDLNHAHVALNRLKLVAAKNLPSHADFERFFAGANDVLNVAAYDRHLRHRLDDATRAYWDGRDFGGRRIRRFARRFHHYGLLGKFIGIAHLVARLHGVDPSRLIAARDLAEQHEFFERELAPLLDRPLVEWLIDRPATLFGLGIPPAQHKALAGDDPGGIKQVLRARLGRLACGFPLDANYFAWQAFARRYDPSPGGSRPPYLELRNFDRVKSGADRVDVRLISMTEHLRQQPAACLDRYVLLDAQDWMDDTMLSALWQQITRTARRGARVIFRTAASHTLLPGRLPNDLLAQWRYEADRSRNWTARDRSAIYGGFHLYVKV